MEKVEETNKVVLIIVIVIIYSFLSVSVSCKNRKVQKYNEIRSTTPGWCKLQTTHNSTHTHKLNRKAPQYMLHIVKSHDNIIAHCKVIQRQLSFCMFELITSFNESRGLFNDLSLLAEGQTGQTGGGRSVKALTPPLQTGKIYHFEVFLFTILYYREILNWQ